VLVTLFAKNFEMTDSKYSAVIGTSQYLIFVDWLNLLNAFQIMPRMNQKIF